MFHVLYTFDMDIFFRFIDQSSRRYLLLSPNCYLTHLLSGRYLWDLYCPKGSLFYRVSKILGGTGLRLQLISWEGFYLPSCFIVQWLRRSIGTSFLISDGITLVALFTLHSVEEEEIEYSQYNNLLVVFFEFIY